MSKSKRNAQIKKYICDLFVKEDEDLILIKQRALQAGFPNIAVPENIGKLLYILTKLQKPKRILELGTLAGYSTTWIAKAAPKAKIVTLECDAKHAAMAKANFKQSNLHDRIEIIEDDALNTLQNLINKQSEPFDLIFLDADKERYPMYLPYLIKLARPGTLLLTDNLIPRDAQINNPMPTELQANRVYEYNALLMSMPNIETIPITTLVGENGRVDAIGVSLIHAI